MHEKIGGHITKIPIDDLFLSHCQAHMYIINVVCSFLDENEKGAVPDITFESM